MLLKLLLKIWPSLIPLTLYVLWVIVIESVILKKLNKQKFIDAQYQEVDQDGQPKEKIGHFSLKNPRFLVVIYLSLILMITSFLFFALNAPRIQEGRYVPSKFKDGRIIPAKIVE